MRVGLLGGTFDPVHRAHLRIAEAAAQQCTLTRVLLAPAADPPHRRDGAIASYEDRLRMVQLACAGHPLLEPSTLDDSPGKSYSIDAILRLRARLQVHDAIYFLLGVDAFAELKSWHRWRELARLVTFAVVDRPDGEYRPIKGAQVERVTGVTLPTSSSAIRRQLASSSPDLDLPPAVLAYIRERGLYGLP